MAQSSTVPFIASWRASGESSLARSSSHTFSDLLTRSIMPVSHKACMFVPFVEEPNLGPIPSLVAVVADMTWLVHVLDAMDEEPQGEAAILD